MILSENFSFVESENISKYFFIFTKIAKISRILHSDYLDIVEISTKDNLYLFFREKWKYLKVLFSRI